MCLAWPIVSAKTVAQKPLGKVIPPLSDGHAVVPAVRLLATVESPLWVPSDLTHPIKTIAAAVKASDLPPRRTVRTALFP
jgi:hypothetical protein